MSLSLCCEHSHLCQNGTSYHKFLGCLRQVIVAHPGFNDSFLSSVPRVVEAISGSKDSPVVLAVDELAKAKAVGEPLDMLIDIGMALDTHAHFHALVTALNAHVVGKVETELGRPIKWIPLPPLSFESSIKAVQEYNLWFHVNLVAPGAAEPEIFEKDLKHCRTACAVLADCNGHPRSLEKALVLLRSYDIKQNATV
jgi:hypothetical protein